MGVSTCNKQRDMEAKPRLMRCSLSSWRRLQNPRPALRESAEAALFVFQLGPFRQSGASHTTSALRPLTSSSKLYRETSVTFQETWRWWTLYPATRPGLSTFEWPTLDTKMSGCPPRPG